jgi:flagellin
MLSINTNLMSLNTARNLSGHYDQLAISTQRLSTGLRINNAADDAAGLAIRELMRAEVASLNQGVRNANDAISMIRTADGALAVINTKLIRMRELATQAATGTITTDQRWIIESEYQAMAAEITRIANATRFNDLQLLQGNLSAAGATIHFGPGNSAAEDFYHIRIATSTASALGVGNTALPAGTAGFTVSTQLDAQRAVVGVEAAILSKDHIRASLGALQNRLTGTVNNLQVQAENVRAAESRISDADVAAEMTTFVRNQILSQSAVAMLAQANALPRMAMQLIGG